MRGSSPHTRGAPAPGFSIRPGAGIIPAYAGSTSWERRRRVPAWDHPRIRGEHRRAPGVGCAVLGSSPHTRGAPVGDDDVFDVVGIIPAYAGSTCRFRLACGMSSRSSPHTRGAPGCSGCWRGCGGIIPAYAGSTRLSGSDGGRGGDHPRIRGEHPALLGDQSEPPGSSPHTRGAPKQPEPAGPA